MEIFLITVLKHILWVTKNIKFIKSIQIQSNFSNESTNKSYENTMSSCTVSSTSLLQLETTSSSTATK